MEIKTPVPPLRRRIRKSRVTTTSQATTNTKDKIVYITAADETPVVIHPPDDKLDIALSLTLITKRIPVSEIHNTTATTKDEVLNGVVTNSDIMRQSTEGYVLYKKSTNSSTNFYNSRY